MVSVTARSKVWVPAPGAAHDVRVCAGCMRPVPICGDCGRPMVRGTGGVPHGFVRHHARGKCDHCCAAARAVTQREARTERRRAKMPAIVSTAATRAEEIAAFRDMGMPDTWIAGRLDLQVESLARRHGLTLASGGR